MRKHVNEHILPELKERFNRMYRAVRSLQEVFNMVTGHGSDEHPGCPAPKYMDPLFYPEHTIVLEE
jgi:hypothetical protein